MRKIKVLHLITHLGFGGASDNTLLSVEHLARSRYEVHLAAGQDYVDWVEQGRRCADALFLFPDMHRDPRPAADVRLLRQLTAFMREQQYDIVHTHNAKAGVIGRMAARRARTPIVLHTMHLLSWQDVHSAPDAGPLRQAATAAKRQLYLGLERYAAALSDRVVLVCEANRQEAIAAGLAPPDRLNTIYSGIDLRRLAVQVGRAAKCQSLGLDPARPIIGMIGRLSAQKAPLDFVAAARLALRRHPQAQFIVAGDGPLAEEVAGAVADEPRIKLLGYRDDVPELYQILDMFVLASLWEGLGRALTEAMIVGIPIVATAVNGIPELVAHGQTGLLAPPADPPRLAEQIVWLLDHPHEAQAMVQRGQQRVLPAFDMRKMVDDIEGLYEQLLAAKGHARQPLDLPRSALS